MRYEPVNPRDDRAVYLQIADQIRGQIQDGSLVPSQQLPSERQLMEGFATARGTVREALGVLKAEGLVVSEHGRGVFVRAKPKIRRKANTRFLRSHREAGLAAFLAETESEGKIANVEMLRLGPETPPEIVMDGLRLQAGDKVLVRSRRYLADGFPVELATSYVPWDLAEGTPMVEPNSGPGGVYARLEERGHRLSHFIEEVGARMPTPDELRQLQLAPGVPVMALMRTAFDVEGRPVEMCDTTMAADRFVLTYNFPAE